LLTNGSTASGCYNKEDLKSLETCEFAWYKDNPNKMFRRKKRMALPEPSYKRKQHKKTSINCKYLGDLEINDVLLIVAKSLYTHKAGF
jgi:hypothetical protein